jgi:hypothetical protein
VGKYKLKCFKTTTYFQIPLFANSLNESQKPVKKEFTIFEQKNCFRQKQTYKIELTLSIQTTNISGLIEMTSMLSDDFQPNKELNCYNL